MTKLTKTAAIAAALILVAAPAFAEQGTTLGGSAKDNSASGGSEASGTSKGGAMTKSSGSMMKSGGAPTTGPGESKGTATGGNAGGPSDKN